MADRAKSQWLRPRVVLPALLGILALTAVLSPVGQDATGRYLSTRSSAINGSHGLRAILDRLGWHTTERITPYSGTLGHERDVRDAQHAPAAQRARDAHPARMRCGAVPS